MPAVLLGQEDITENPRPAEELEENETTHTAAFLVLIDKDGNFVFEPNINKVVIPERAVKPVEVKTSLSALLDEIRNQEIAITMINMQMQMARQAQEQAQNQQILQQMGRMPGR